MALSYETIKKLAKENGLRVTDLIALSPQNDPFYCGTEGDWIKARWFRQVWDMGGYRQGAHLRRIHYFCVSQPGMKTFAGLPYENTMACWKDLTQCAKLARYMGLVDIADIADHKNPDPQIFAARYKDTDPRYEVELPDPAVPNINIYGLYNSHAQPYLMEIWCEKSTMDDVLAPLAEKYYANLATFEGEASITACYNLAARISTRRKPTRIFYISDFDPGGMSMPMASARKLEWLLKKYNIPYDVKLKHIVLTYEQVQQYQLPRTPIKDSERRGDAFRENYGEGAVELDALEALYPGTLNDIVERELARYYDPLVEAIVQVSVSNLETDLLHYIQSVADEYADAIAQVREMQEQITEEVEGHVEALDYAVPRDDMDVDEDPDEWLFDSGRKYIEQIDAYKAHKRGD